MGYGLGFRLEGVQAQGGKRRYAVVAVRRTGTTCRDGLRVGFRRCMFNGSGVTMGFQDLQNNPKGPRTQMMGF